MSHAKYQLNKHGIRMLDRPIPTHAEERAKARGGVDLNVLHIRSMIERGETRVLTTTSRARDGERRVQQHLVTLNDGVEAVVTYDPHMRHVMTTNAVNRVVRTNLGDILKEKLA